MKISKVFDFISDYPLPLTIVLVIILCIIGTVRGFQTEQATIKSCQVRYETFQTAHFSETVVSICTSMDANGNMTTRPCTTTNYWKELASPIWYAITVDDFIDTNSLDHYPSNHGYEISSVPPRNRSFDSHSDFDYYQSSKKTSFTVYVDLLSEQLSFDEKPELFKGCQINRKNAQPVEVKTWYGNPYKMEVML